MPSSTQVLKADIEVECYGLNDIRRVRKVVAFCVSQGVVCGTIYRIDRLGNLLGVLDSVSGGMVYVKVHRWSGDMMRAEWTNIPALISRNLKSQAKKAIIKHLSLPGGTTAKRFKLSLTRGANQTVFAS